MIWLILFLHYAGFLYTWGIAQRSADKTSETMTGLTGKQMIILFWAWPHYLGYVK